MGISRFFNKTLTQKRKASGTGHPVEAWAIITTFKGCVFPVGAAGSATQSVYIKLNVTHKMYCPMGPAFKVGDKIAHGIVVAGTDIEFHDNGGAEDTITSVAGAFGVFKTGDVIEVCGSASNDGRYTVISVVAGTINVKTASLVAEGVGASVVITSGDEYIVKKKPNWDKFQDVLLSEGS